MMSLFPRLLTGVVLMALVACADESKQPAGDDRQSTREAGDFLAYDVAKHRKRAVSEPAYSIEIDLERAPGTYGGTVTANFKYGGDGDALTVDFRSGEVLAVTLNGEEVPFDYNGYFITLPAGSLSPGEQELVVEYEHPFSQDGAGLYRYEDPEDGRVYLYTDFEPYDANRLFPHFDQPDLKARYTLSVRAPADWQVISTTRENDIVDEGEHRVWHFPATEPISSYIFSLHAGEYAVFEDRDFRYPLRLFVRQSLAEYTDAEYWFDITRQGFDYFDEYFGLPYPFQKYDQVIVPDFISGAMENVAAVTFSETFLHRGEVTRRQRMNLASVILHEMAHMWFGDITTMAWWNGLWLNESFATYMAHLALSNGTEFKEAWHEFFIGDKQWAYAEDQLVTTHPIELPVEDTSVATTNFDGITYGKGASVLKQLGFLLGDEVFRQGIRDYLAANAWANTELEDFTGALGTAADRNLDGWTRRWLYEAGLNTVEVDYQCDGETLKSMALVQSAPEGYPTLREQRTVLAFYRLEGDRLVLERELPMEFAGEHTPVPGIEGKPCPDFIYPNYRDFAFMKVALDERSIATLREHIVALEDPLQRNMAWYDLFNMVRDARLPLTDFLDILEAHVAEETDLNAAANLMWNLRLGFSYLRQVPGGENLLPDYAERFESLLWKLVESSDGDARQLWLSAYIDTANNEVAWQRLEDLLKGEVSLPGFELDQDQRWRIVLKLNEHLWPGHRELAVLEADRDRSSIGQENTVRAEVLSARGEAKSRWLDKATRADDQYSLRRSRTIVAGLFPYSSQRNLASPFAVEMMAQLPRLDEEHNTTFHDNVTALLMPRLCTAENVERLKAAAERYSDLDPAIVKGIKVAAQLDERCVNIGALLAKARPDEARVSQR
jgi:aminopeptidase N